MNHDELMAVMPDEAARQRDFYRAVSAERVRQLQKWGDQRRPDGTGMPGAQNNAESARAWCQAAATKDAVTWTHILREEIYEAFAETDPVKLRAELVQCGAVIAAWLSDLDRRD